MKSDTTTLVLNFVLAALVILGVVFAVLAMNRTRDLRLLTSQASQCQSALVKAQALANDTATYNVTAKSPELTKILNAIQPKTAPAK